MDTPEGMRSIEELAAAQSEHKTRLAKEQEAAEQEELKQQVPNLHRERDRLLEESKQIQGEKDEADLSEVRRGIKLSDTRKEAEGLATAKQDKWGEIGELGEYIKRIDGIAPEEELAPDVLQAKRDAESKRNRLDGEIADADKRIAELVKRQGELSEANPRPAELGGRLEEINKDMADVESNPYLVERLHDMAEREDFERNILIDKARKMFGDTFPQFASLNFTKQIEIKVDPEHRGETKVIHVHPAYEFVNTVCNIYVSERMRNEGASVEKVASEEAQQLGRHQNDSSEGSDLKKLLAMHGTFTEHTPFRGGMAIFAKAHPVSLNYALLFYGKMQSLYREELRAWIEPNKMVQALKEKGFEITEEGFALPKELTEKQRKEYLNILKNLNSNIDGYVEGLNPKKAEEEVGPEVEARSEEEQQVVEEEPKKEGFWARLRRRRESNG